MNKLICISVSYIHINSTRNKTKSVTLVENSASLLLKNVRVVVIFVYQKNVASQLLISLVFSIRDLN